MLTADDAFAPHSSKPFYQFYSGRAAESSAMMSRVELWLKGLLAAAISGAAGGVLTGLAAVGLHPPHFHPQNGRGPNVSLRPPAPPLHPPNRRAPSLQQS